MLGRFQHLGSICKLLLESNIDFHIILIHLDGELGLGSGLLWHFGVYLRLLLFGLLELLFLTDGLVVLR